MNKIYTLIFLLFSSGLLGQDIDKEYFDKADTLFARFVDEGQVDYMNLKGNAELAELIQFIADFDYTTLDSGKRKAYLINAYNLLVLDEALKAYPIGSVQDIPGFFDRKKVTINGQQWTLTDFEKSELLRSYEDARLHFVLVCAAVSCPKITPFAYRPETIEQQIEKQTKIALNDPLFIWIEDDKIQLSQIFRWYVSDFGGSKNSILAFINNFREQPFADNASVNYYDYNWNLNTLSTSGTGPIIATNAARYIVSSTIPKGQTETKIFNNLYSQTIGGESRSTFFTTATSFLYGFNKRLNLGFQASYRRVQNIGIPSSPFAVLTNPGAAEFRQGITAIGPQIRWAAVPKWSNFSIQSRFMIPIGQNLSGGDGKPFIDWQGPSFFNQFFNDRAIGTRFSLFTEVGLHWEDIGLLSRGRINQVSTPLTGILSYSPTTKLIFYALGNFTPFYRIPFDYFMQAGVGSKYQFTRNFEIELLYTGFTNKFLLQNDGGAATYNVGFRFNI